jgi:4-amino-4-deoxy-L-arabinose transferase-like glycosyltransferase
MEHRTAIANHQVSARFWVLAAVVGLLLGGAAFWGANKRALGLFHDDGIYTVVAKALSQGDGYRIISLPVAPPQTKYPFLYSYLLSWIWALDSNFPQNIIFLKSLNIAILAAIFFVSVVFYRRYFPEAKFAALIFALVVCTNPVIFTYTDYVISDLLFVMLALITLTIGAAHASASDPRFGVPLLALVTGLACLTRLAAAPLVLAGGLYSFTRRGWRGVAYFIGVLALFLVPWFLWVSRAAFPSTDSLYAYYAAYDFGAARAGDASAWARQLWIVVVGNARHLAVSFEVLYLTPLMPGLYFLVIALSTIGMIASMRRAELVNWSFFLSSVALLLIWPFHPGRYLGPLVAILILFLFRGMNTIEQWLDSISGDYPLAKLGRKISWCPTVLILIVNGVWLSSYLLIRDDKTTRGVYGYRMSYAWSGFEESFAWIRQHTATDALLATAYDPMYYLYTGRRAIRPALHRSVTYFYPYGDARPDVGSVEVIKPQLDKLKVGYLVIDPMDGYAEGNATLRLFDGLVAAYGDRAKNVFTSMDGKHKIYALAVD